MNPCEPAGRRRPRDPTGRKCLLSANRVWCKRIYSHARKEAYRTLAQKAIQYTAEHQRANGFGDYGGGANAHCIDNFRIACVSDSLNYYIIAAGDDRFQEKRDSSIGRTPSPARRHSEILRPQAATDRYAALLGGDRHPRFLPRPRSSELVAGLETRQLDERAYAG